MATNWADNGMIAACVFTDPKPIMDDTFLLDYSLFFITTLLEYYVATNDRKALLELSGIALEQLEFAKGYLDKNHIIQGEGDYHCFIDWNEQLDKQCAMQAIYLYSLRNAALNDLTESPYGSSIINSYCHVWSCTPAYFMREYDFLFLSV